jgi:hypothetical protein
MGLLRDIQTALMEGQPIGPILLKLRFLASRLGSNVLEEWVKHESEGYPLEVVLPSYRKVPVSYVASFSGPFGSGIKNAPIPPYLIEKFAGPRWNNYEIRQGVSSIDDLISSGKGSGALHINAANLILLLQGKVYEDYACNSVTGRLSKASLIEIQNVVRARVLELTIQIEKTIPAAIEIAIGPLKEVPGQKEKEAVTQITNQVIHGNYTSVSNSGVAQFTLTVNSNDVGSVVKALQGAGIAEADATEIATIFSSETPESAQEPFGKRARSWIAKNISKAADGSWKAGVAVATQVLTEAALKYYGLK